MASATARLRGQFLGIVRRAFGEFLALPLAVLLAFVALAFLLYWVDDVVWTRPGDHPARTTLERLLGDSAALSSLLATVATSMITVTSITFSLLLVAVQQGASALTSQVFDQFLRRRWNQFYFGFFVGLSIFVLIALVTVSSLHRPIFATLVALLLTACALCMMVVLIYNTVDQMRPAQIVDAIHRFALAARERQVPLLAATRRRPDMQLGNLCAVEADDDGVVARIDVATLTKAVREIAADLEIELLVAVGSSVAYRSRLAQVRGATPLSDEDAHALRATIRLAVVLDRGRDLACDPAYAVEQLATIGWTSVSTAKSNPQPGLLVVRAITDLASRWGEDESALASSDPSSPVVYPDRVVEEALAALESLAVVTSESMQHQTLAAILRAFALMVRILPDRLASDVDEAAMRSLSALGEHVPTAILNAAIVELEAALAARGLAQGAASVRQARLALAASVGHLNSRSTRVPGA